ncbi:MULTISPECIES: MucR family transcriptional regulator [unclassified Sulfitobacter]|uniref:MucR family transcriptional regulator n=1 Tax=unclassified Sulfitobacter TaxID=196795 RepID=UPI0015933F9E|nr:MucR family transcriptional regulator [Sulfitobacter sp. HGT1]
MSDFLDVSLPKATVSILTAFAGREHVTVEEVLSLARELPKVLAENAGYKKTAVASKELPQAPPSDAPMVDVANSVTEDAVICLCCGRAFTMLKRHLRAEHGLTEAAYREKFNLADDHLLVAPSYSIRKAATAKRIGLGKYSRENTDQSPPVSGA